MLTYHRAAEPLSRRLLPAIIALSALICVASRLQAQERRYLFEVGGAASFQSYSNDTGLETSFGGLGR
ncbi:MAG: hypothetical protein ACJ8A6_03465, partial [Gemmatimonadales bacterium]